MVLPLAPVHADYSNPSGVESDIIYNTDYHAHQFCNGAQWKAMTGVVLISNILPPAGSGYFVMTNGTWSGNLGGLAGADAKCLSDLTTNTGWMGYADANSRGLLVAAKVHAFICSTSAVCNNLMPPTSDYSRMRTMARRAGELHDRQQRSRPEQ